MAVADWKSYNKFADKIGLGNETFIQLDRHGAAESEGAALTGGGGAAKAPVDAAEGSGDAKSTAKLMQDAAQALQRNDRVTAQGELDKVKALKPEERGLWAMYGYLEIRRGEISAGIADMEKELKLHPSETPVYQSLVQAELAASRRSDAQDACGAGRLRLLRTRRHW